MKSIVKMNFLEVHLNPIHRDLLMVVTIAMVVAITFVSLGMMIVSQF